MLYLSSLHIRQALSMREAIDAVEGAFVALSEGTALSPIRQSLSHGDTGVTLVMPAVVAGACSVKVVSVHPRNRGGEHPVVQAQVVLVDPSNGVPLAMLEGGSLTALRTGAASGVATRWLARRDAEVATIFGAGVQGRAQYAAMAAIRSLRRVWVFDRTAEKAAAFVEELRGAVEARVARSAEEAVAEADIICTATTSTTPVLDGRWMREGCHVNAIGSYTPSMQEVDVETLRRAAKIVVDSREAAWQEAGDLIAARAAGALDDAGVHAEIGEIAAGRRPGREDEREITYFKSVGNAVQDAAVARVIYDKARSAGLGLELT